MTPILQFEKVSHYLFGQLSFRLDAGEIRVLVLSNKDAKPVVMDMIMGEQLPENGDILIRGKHPETVTTGLTGAILANGGMISNLKVWENITLPKWYHGSRLKSQTEAAVISWLKIMQHEESDWERFMSSPVAKLRNSERKQAGILRMMVQAPELIVMDATIFDDVDESKKSKWIATLEQFVAENRDRAILVLSYQTNEMPWPGVE